MYPDSCISVSSITQLYCPISVAYTFGSRVLECVTCYAGSAPALGSNLVWDLSRAVCVTSRPTPAASSTPALTAEVARVNTPAGAPIGDRQP